MTKTKLIIEINEEILNNPYNFPEYVFRKAVLNGKPLQAEFEDIKAEINAKERVELSTKEMWYNFALADVIHILDNHIKELKGEQK